MKNGRQNTNNIVHSLQYLSKDFKVLVKMQILRTYLIIKKTFHKIRKKLFAEFILQITEYLQISKK